MLKKHNNSKAIITWDYYPLNYTLLYNPDIIRIKGPTIYLTNNSSTYDENEIKNQVVENTK